MTDEHEHIAALRELWSICTPTEMQKEFGVKQLTRVSAYQAQAFADAILFIVGKNTDLRAVLLRIEETAGSFGDVCECDSYNGFVCLICQIRAMARAVREEDAAHLKAP